MSSTMPKYILDWMGEHPILAFLLASIIGKTFVEALPFIGAHPFLGLILFAMATTVAIVALVMPVHHEEDVAEEDDNDD